MTPSTNIAHSWKDSHRLSNYAIDNKTREPMALCELEPGIGTGGGWCQHDSERHGVKQLST